MTHRSIILVFFLTLLISTGLATATKTLHLDYLGDDYLVVESPDGVISFVGSPQPETDLSVVKIVNTSILSLYWIKSNNISSQIDENFVNNTKYYNFTISNPAEALVVYVDYSSLKVPHGIIQQLEEKIAELNIKIDSLNNTINNLLANNTNLSVNITEKENLISSMETSLANAVVERDEAVTLKNQYETQNTELSTTNQNLGSIVQNLTSDISTKDSVIDTLKDQIELLDIEKEAKDNTIEKLESPFTLFYNRGDVEGLFHFNIFSMLLGGVIFLGIYVLIQRQTSYGRKTLLDSIANKARGIPIIGSSVKRSPQEWDMLEKIEDDVPSVEKQFLKEEVKHEPKSIEQIRSEIDNENLSTKKKEPDEPEPEKPEPKPKKDKPKPKVNYWDTPAGMRRREKMRKASKGEE